MNAEHTRERSRRYSAIKTRFFVADIFITFAALVFFQLVISRPISRIITGVWSNFYAACFFYLCIFLLFMYLVGLPLHLGSSFFLERRFSLSERSFGSWLTDEAKSVCLSFILSVACFEVFYLVLRNFPRFWWAIGAGLWILFSIVLARLLPVLLIPLFYKYLPIEDEELRRRIMAAADRAGIRLMDVCQIDFSRKTKKANAALVGLGKTRKVILADTLVREFTPGEVETVVAHEFGHCRYKHIWQLLVFSAVLTLSGFFILFLAAGRVAALAGAESLADLYLLPGLIILMIISGLIVLPVQNLFSRVLERQADRYALELTDNDAERFIAVMTKLADMNLADTEPSLLKKVFLYDHPPISERIRMAERAGGVDEE